MSAQFYNRQSIRVQGYDYSQNGVYFLTLCTEDRHCILGSIENGEMTLNPAGKMVKRWWEELEHKFKNVQLEKFVIMPNHIHGIIRIIHHKPTVGADLCVCPSENVLNPTSSQPVNDVRVQQGAHAGAPLRGDQSNAPISRMVQWFKTMTTNEYIRAVKSGNVPRFDTRIWQRNYYEHVIRNKKSYHEIGNYIVSKPRKWEHDTMYTP